MVETYSSLYYPDEEETEQGHNNVCSVPNYNTMLHSRIIRGICGRDSAHCAEETEQETIAVCSVPISIIPQQDYQEHLW